ncbi:hypothetical protein [Streptomyces sp. TP-A0874]|uniref:hypothetical protein n=1 Tax=Streptomyces sp. TP-A0874 TaxID=549819 RepID=UPI001112E951|nr:hypothetical protein [Streptomyces sp. TP-A0874]
MGNTAPLQMAVWYLRGPLAVLLLTAPALLAAGGETVHGLLPLAWPPLIGVVALYWIHRAAPRQNR